MKLLDLISNPALLEAKAKKKRKRRKKTKKESQQDTLVQNVPSLDRDVSEFLRNRVVALLKDETADTIETWQERYKWNILRKRGLIGKSRSKEKIKPTKAGLPFLVAVSGGKISTPAQANQWMEDNKKALGLKKIPDDPEPQIKKEAMRKVEDPSRRPPPPEKQIEDDDDTGVKAATGGEPEPEGEKAWLTADEVIDKLKINTAILSTLKSTQDPETGDFYLKAKQDDEGNLLFEPSRIEELEGKDISELVRQKDESELEDDEPEEKIETPAGGLTPSVEKDDAAEAADVPEGSVGGGTNIPPIAPEVAKRSVPIEPTDEDRERTRNLLEKLDKQQIVALISLFAQSQKYKKWEEIINLAQNVANPARAKYQGEYNKLMRWIKTGPKGETKDPVFKFKTSEGGEQDRIARVTLQNEPIPESLLREAEERYAATFYDLINALVAKTGADAKAVGDAFQMHLDLGNNSRAAEKEDIDITTMIAVMKRHATGEPGKAGEEETDEAGEEEIDAGELESTITPEQIAEKYGEAAADRIKQLAYQRHVKIKIKGDKVLYNRDEVEERLEGEEILKRAPSEPGEAVEAGEPIKNVHYGIAGTIKSIAGSDYKIESEMVEDPEVPKGTYVAKATIDFGALGDVGEETFIYLPFEFVEDIVAKSMEEYDLAKRGAKTAMYKQMKKEQTKKWIALIGKAFNELSNNLSIRGIQPTSAKYGAPAVVSKVSIRSPRARPFDIYILSETGEGEMAESILNTMEPLFEDMEDYIDADMLLGAMNLGK